MPHGAVELTIKAALIAAAFFAISDRREAKLPPRSAGVALVLLAALSAAAYFNIGIQAEQHRGWSWRQTWSRFGERWLEGRPQSFHGAGYVHHWETFHYVLGSKYFPELGYDGLYAASVAAERESHPRNRPMPEVRDLRTNVLVPYARLQGEMRRVKERFGDERWEQFKADNAYFIDRTGWEYMRQIRIDHGYNPSPFWTFVARVFDARTPLTHPFVVALTCLDPLLVALAFLAILWAYGPRIACITLILFGLGYPWRFYWVGGAFLRYDWFAATVVGICMLKKERWALGGAFLAYGALVRVFPVLFLFGIGVVGLRAIIRKEDRRWLYAFSAGYAAMIVFGVAAGASTGHGLESWVEFIENSRKHTSTWLTNNIGLQNVLLYGPDTYARRLVNYDLPEAFIHWHEHLTYLRGQMMPLIVLAAGAMLALTAGAAWRSTPSEAAALGIVPCFSLLLLTCYYWSMLVVVPLRRGTDATLGALVLSSACILVHALTGGFEVIYGACSWAMLVLFVTWLWPDAVKTFKKEPLTADELAGAESLNADMR